MADQLTIKEAYMAMFTYLDKLYQLTKSDDLAIALGSMELMDDEIPRDSAAWEDWIDAVNKVTGNDT